MRNPIKDIVTFNEKAGLLDKGYNDFLESSFQIEEALEGFDTCRFGNVLEELDVFSSPKDISRALAARCRIPANGISDVDRLDKACDSVVYAIGSMAKLGLNAQQITKALNIVMEANNAKLGMTKDEFGKLGKPKDFKGPEVKLQKLLDERK